MMINWIGRADSRHTLQTSQVGCLRPLFATLPFRKREVHTRHWYVGLYFTPFT